MSAKCRVIVLGGDQFKANKQLSVSLQFLTTNVRAVKITAKDFQNNDLGQLTYFEY